MADLQVNAHEMSQRVTATHVFWLGSSVSLNKFCTLFFRKASRCSFQAHPVSVTNFPKSMKKRQNQYASKHHKIQKRKVENLSCKEHYFLLSLLVEDTCI